ncbi:MAG: hypothetical protein OEX97_09695 [Acidimicrobiia bacterium]|nr:hypothetical protein [Acidimicrobiia bacterium]
MLDNVRDWGDLCVGSLVEDGENARVRVPPNTSVANEWGKGSFIRAAPPTLDPDPVDIELPRSQPGRKRLMIPEN